MGNRDVEPFVPTLIGAMLRPTEASEAIHKLGAVTFVQARVTRVATGHASVQSAIFCAVRPYCATLLRITVFPRSRSGKKSQRWYVYSCFGPSASIILIIFASGSCCPMGQTYRRLAQAVESPCLSILVPLLVKGLRERAAVARKTGLIIHNMVKVRARALPAHLTSSMALSLLLCETCRCLIPRSKQT